MPEAESRLKQFLMAPFAQRRQAQRRLCAGFTGNFRVLGQVMDKVSLGCESSVVSKVLIGDSKVAKVFKMDLNDTFDHGP